MGIRSGQLYIGGEWQDSASGTFDDMNPYTGEVYAEVAAGSAADATRAVEAASAAFDEWSNTPPSFRRRIFLKAADVMEARREELVTAMMEEVGGTIGIAMFQMHFVPGLLRMVAGAPYEVKGEVIPADHANSFFMSVRRPAGVVACFAPFNVPYILATRGFAVALAYGNTVVLKPSEEAPITGGVLLAEIFEEAGLPPGVLNVVTTTREDAPAVGEALIGNDAVRRVSFTGSSDVGRHIAETSGRHLKRAILELGGKDPLIVLADADVDYAVDAAAWGAFLHQGQICMSTERIIVDRSIADEFVGRLVERAEELPMGDPTDPSTVIGPLINHRAVEKVDAHVKEAVDMGGTLVTGGKHDGLVYHPTVVTDVSPNTKLFSEQTFGPVAPIIVVDDRDEALAVANNSSYGLSSGILTSDLTVALEMAFRLDTGMVHIGDQTVNDEPQVPFGGVKNSGYGRFGAQAALDEFTELKWINIQTKPRTFP